MQRKFIPLTIFALLPLCILIVYFPGLSGGFVFDDFSNIVLSPGIAIQEFSLDSIKNAALSMDGRPIARATFGLNYLLAGLDPFYFKLVNIIIHSINSMLLFGLMLLVVRHQLAKTQLKATESNALLIAAVVALAWALHPVNLTNVLYSVQRMNSMSAMFVLAGMISYISGRLSLDGSPVKGWFLIIISVVIFLPLAWLSKENGALLPLFLFVLEVTFFRFSVADEKHKKGLYSFFIIFLLIPAIVGIYFIVQHYDFFQQGYGNRHFDLIERLLTEPRIIWLYIRMILLPTPSIYSLFLDDIDVSSSLLEPISTLFAIAGTTVLFTLAIFSIKRAPVLAFGLLFFFVGHLMESTIIPLELAFEHRNYLPSIGLLLPLFYYIHTAGRENTYRKSRIALMSIIVLVLAVYTHLRAWQWSDNVRLYIAEVNYHPNSIRANYEAGKIYGQRMERGQGDLELNYREAIKYFARVTQLQKNSTSGLFGSIIASIDSGNQINPQWIDQLAHRLKNQPLEQVSILWLDKLTDCVSMGKCNKDIVQIPRLIRSALAYTELNQRNRALLHTILAKYYYSVERNTDQAINYGRRAISSNRSNLYYHLNLSKFLLTAGKKKETIEVLDALSGLDINGQHTAEIAKLRKMAE